MEKNRNNSSTTTGTEQQQQHIPTLTVTSSDSLSHIDANAETDVGIKRNGDDDARQFANDSSADLGAYLSEQCAESRKIVPPTNLDLSIAKESENFEMKSKFNKDSQYKQLPRVSTTSALPKLKSGDVLDPVMKVSRSSSLLSPMCLSGGYDSDLSLNAGTLTDYDECDLSSGKIQHLSMTNVDSDPTESISPRKKALRKIKSLKSSLKSRKNEEENKQTNLKSSDEHKIIDTSPTEKSSDKTFSDKEGMLENGVELSLLSVDEGGIVITEKKSKGKSKLGKSRKKTRKNHLSKVAQKFSDRQVLSPSYKQKNDDFHKFFKELPSSERLLVDYNCAFVKDILIQGRLYASQNYLCFHSNILKWQTAVTVKFVEIDSMTKEKTVKVIPNAIQFILKDKTKMTFTSFTARDRAYIMTFRLWQNALLDKPMSPTELWTHVHSNYGEELGLCSSDDDYVKPHQMPKKHQSIDSPSLEGLEKYEFGTTNKVKKKKKQNSFAVFPTEEETATRSEKKLKKSKSSSSGARQSSQESNNAFHVGTDNSTVDEKSIPDDVSEDEQEMLDDDSSIQDESRRSSKQDEDDLEEEDDDEPAPFVLQDAAKVSMSCQYETTARDMFRIIFGDDCGFWKDTLVKKHTTEIDIGTWYEDEKVKGQALRDLSYTLRLDNPIGPKTSHCKETQILYPSSIPGKTYGIDCVVQNYGIPYAYYFQTCMRYCIKKTSRTSCQVRVTSEIRYKKTPWGLIKNFIEKNVNSGLSDNFKKLELQLQERVEYEKQHPNIEPEEKRSNLRLRKNKSRDEDSRKPASLSYGTIPTKNLLKSDLNNNQHRSREGMSTFPSLLPPNGYIPNSSTDRMKYSSSRLMFGTILFIFLLLLYSNYSMYQRLTTLEQVTTAAATADGVDPSVTAALLDRPGVSITENPELLATYLQAIDKRLRRLETAMLKYAEDSNSKWSQMQSEWSLLHIAIDKALKQKEAKQKPLVHHP